MAEGPRGPRARRPARWAAWRRALAGLAEPHVTHAVLAELRSLGISAEVRHIEHPGLVAPQPEAVGDLEQGGVPERRPPALPPRRPDRLHLPVRVVEERLQLIEGGGPLGRTGFIR